MMYSPTQSLSLQNANKVIRHEAHFRQPVQKEDGFTAVSIKLIAEIANSLMSDLRQGLNSLAQDIKTSVDESMFMITKLID